MLRREHEPLPQGTYSQASARAGFRRCVPIVVSTLDMTLLRKVLDFLKKGKE